MPINPTYQITGCPREAHALCKQNLAADVHTARAELDALDKEAKIEFAIEPQSE